jgi:hypothetical protein
MVETLNLILSWEVNVALLIVRVLGIFLTKKECIWKAKDHVCERM